MTKEITKQKKHKTIMLKKLFCPDRTQEKTLNWKKDSNLGCKKGHLLMKIGEREEKKARTQKLNTKTNQRTKTQHHSVVWLKQQVT